MIYNLDFNSLRKQRVPFELFQFVFNKSSLRAYKYIRIYLFTIKRFISTA